MQALFILPRIVVGTLVLIAVALAVSACSGGSYKSSNSSTPTAESGGAATPASETNPGPVPTASSGTVTVTESEYKIQVDPKSVEPSELSFILTNQGTMPHEFVIIKTDLAADKLPVDSSTSTVNESDSRVTKVYRYDQYPPNQSNLVHLHLDPGRYVFICNLPAHYSQGMRVDFTVGGSQGGGR
jgi:uncharacterized cupredoxin-like copper-binding protein